MSNQILIGSKVENGFRFFTLPDNSGQKCTNQLGYRKLEVLSAGEDGTSYGGTEELWIFPEIFKDDLCGGVNQIDVAKELIARGWLSAGSDGKTSKLKKINGKPRRLYCFQKWYSEVLPVLPVLPEGREPFPEVTHKEKQGVTGVTGGAVAVTPVTPDEKQSVTAGDSSQSEGNTGNTGNTHEDISQEISTSDLQDADGGYWDE